MRRVTERECCARCATAPPSRAPCTEPAEPFAVLLLRVALASEVSDDLHILHPACLRVGYRRRDSEGPGQHGRHIDRVPENV